jgi:hypothetical protein
MFNYFSDISLWWLLPIGLLSAALAYVYYYKPRTGQDWTKKQLRILFSLRAVGLFLLTLLLIGLLWESIRYRDEKPLFITMVDNSASMTNYSDSAKVKSRIEGFRQQLEERFGDRFELMTLEVGEKTSALKQIDFSGKQTNLADGFEHVRELFFNRNIGGITLISDGNFNLGTHPMYSAERIELTPVFTLGVGDTLTRRDQLIKSINTNEVAFLNNQFPIEATVDFNRIPIGPVTVSLQHQGRTIATQTVTCTNAVFDQQQVLFNVDARSKGFQRYTIVLEHKSGEYTFDNNRQTCYIEILDNKNLICLLSSAPHPDLGAIRAILEEDQQSTIATGLTTTYTLPKERPNLVIWYENGAKPNAPLFKSIREKKIPIFLILGPTTPSSVVKSYDIGLLIPGGSQQDDVQGVVSGGFSAFSFTSAFTDALQVYPPLRTRFGTYNLPANAEVILTQRIGNIAKKDPLLFVSQRENAKIGVLLGEGLWRWKIKEFSQRRSVDGFREFIQKTIQYLVVRQNTEPLRVTLPKRFNVTEDVEVKAEFYNEAMELITTPEIVLTLTSPQKKKSKIDFSPLSNFYKANAGQLDAGTYSWTVTATHNGKKYTKSGDFVVEDISVEQADTRADFSVLNQLSAQSEGTFRPLKDASKLLDEIGKRGDITTLQYADSGYTALIDWKWIFVFLILVFGTEWFLRRWWGTY